MENIKRIFAQGQREYFVGQKIGDDEIESIKLEWLTFQGDPFDHYVGKSKEGKILFHY